MKLAGPEHPMAETWAKLEQIIAVGEPRGNEGKSMTFLGCEHTLLQRSRASRFAA